MYVEKPSNPTNSSCSEHSVKLNNKERAIVNYLKLQKFSPTTTPPIVDLVSDVEIAGATQIKGGVAVVKMILEDLKKKGVVKRDRYGNWGLADRVNYLLKFKLENSSKLSPEVNSTPEDKKSTIELMARDGQLFARVKDLKKHPLNAQIYSTRNIQPLLAKIRETQWIKTLGTRLGKLSKNSYLRPSSKYAPMLFKDDRIKQKGDLVEKKLYQKLNLVPHFFESYLTSSQVFVYHQITTLNSKKQLLSSAFICAGQFFCYTGISTSKTCWQDWPWASKLSTRDNNCFKASRVKE